MYHYIVDQSRIPTKNFDKLLGEIYGYLTEYQISGEVHRVTLLRNLPELVEMSLRSGARTLIAVGDDLTFWQVAEMSLGMENVVVGYIPLVKNSEIAKIFGLGNLSACCRAIAQRRVEIFDVGQVNRNHFFTYLTFGSLNASGDLMGAGFFRSLGMIGQLKSLPVFSVNVTVDGQYSLSLDVVAGAVINAREPNLCRRGLAGSPSDGLLDLTLLDRPGARQLFKYRRDLLRFCLENIPGATVLHGRYFEISSPQNATVFSGPHPISKMPLVVHISDKKLRVIVGKDR